MLTRAFNMHNSAWKLAFVKLAYHFHAKVSKFSILTENVANTLYKEVFSRNCSSLPPPNPYIHTDGGGNHGDLNNSNKQALSPRGPYICKLGRCKGYHKSQGRCHAVMGCNHAAESLPFTKCPVTTLMGHAQSNL